MGGLETKGVIVRSDGDLTVHAINAERAAVDGYLSVPLEATATEFYIPSYTPLSTRESEFTVVAAEDNTVVTISLRQSNGAYTRYGTFTLRRLQTYSMRSNSRDLTGTHVNATKPVGVVAGHECANVPTGTSFCDHMAVGVPPLSALGEEFVVTPLAGRSSSTGYRLRVISTAANTIVRTDSFGSSTLSRGQFREYDVRNSFQAMNVTCSNPCLLAQYNKGHSVDRQQTDPFMMLIKPTFRYKNQLAVRTTYQFSRRPFLRNYINIVVERGTFLYVFIILSITASEYIV